MIDFIQKVATEAGNIILRSSRAILREKEGGGNFVLNADLRSEEYLFDSIQRAFPGHIILSEETRSQILHPEQQECLWIIDPLDGTTNAKSGIPFFAVSVAYAEKGIVLAGGILDPNRQEFFGAEKGKEAFCNGKKIKFAETENLKNLIINIGSPYSEENFSLTYPLAKEFHQQGARIINFGSAALECAWVACGRIGAYLEAGLKPWDIAAAQLILSEAGGVMIDPYKSEKKFSIFDQKAILVGNRSIVNQLRKIIR